MSLTAAPLTPALERRSAPVIEMPPAGVLPSPAQAALESYCAAPTPAVWSQLVVAVDQVGHGWEYAIARRSAAVRAELVAACRQVGDLHDELVELRAAAGWLRSFPGHPTWRPEPYSLQVAGEEVAVPEILGAIEDACDFDPRLRAIASRHGPPEPAYVSPARRGLCQAPAANALAEAGVTLTEVADLMPGGGVSVSTVSRWMGGSRPYPDALRDVLERLVGADAAGAVLALIPRSP